MSRHLAELLNEDRYASIATFYDLEYETYQEDLAFFLNLVKRTGGPVLDAGAGTGRVAIALARAGYSVVALDNSPAMLARGRRKVRGGLARRVRLVQGDMRDFRVEERFPLAILAVNTFAHMVTRQDQERALTCLRERLTPDGLLVLALENPYPWVINSPENELVLCWEKEGPGPGERTRLSQAAWLDLEGQTRHVRLWYDVTAADGALRRYAAQLALRWFYRPELELLLERQGLRGEAWYGSYDLEPYSGNSPFLIAVAAKA